MDGCFCKYVMSDILLYNIILDTMHQQLLRYHNYDLFFGATPQFVEIIP